MTAAGGQRPPGGQRPRGVQQALSPSQLAQPETRPRRPPTIDRRAAHPGLPSYPRHAPGPCHWNSSFLFPRQVSCTLCGHQSAQSRSGHSHIALAAVVDY